MSRTRARVRADGEVIFLDLDDTLLDHSGAADRAARLFGERFHAAIPDYDASRFASRWHAASARHMEDFLAGRIDFQEQRRRRLRTIFRNDALTAHGADALFGVYLKFYESAWKPFPDVVPFLEAHAACGLGVISNGAHAQQLRKLERLGIRRYFACVITPESFGCAKPDPRMFRRACELSGIEPRSACHIGDDLDNDARAAAAAGLRGIWIHRVATDAPTPGVERIASLREYVGRS